MLSITGQTPLRKNFFFFVLTTVRPEYCWIFHNKCWLRIVHCLDPLRQAIMCHGDTSLITFKWGTKQPVPSANWSTPHTCRSWEALEEWNKERFVNVFQTGLVVHPKFGKNSDCKFHAESMTDCDRSRLWRPIWTRRYRNSDRMTLPRKVQSG